MAEKPTTLPRKLAWKQEEDITQAVFSKEDRIKRFLLFTFII